MTDRPTTGLPMTESRLAAALRKSMPGGAPVGSAERLAVALRSTRQRRRLPSVLRVFWDVDPLAFRWSAAAAVVLLLALLLAAFAAAGAARLLTTPRWTSRSRRPSTSRRSWRPHTTRGTARRRCTSSSPTSDRKRRRPRRCPRLRRPIPVQDRLRRRSGRGSARARGDRREPHRDLQVGDRRQRRAVEPEPGTRIVPGSRPALPAQLWPALAAGRMPGRLAPPRRRASGAVRHGPSRLRRRGLLDRPGSRLVVRTQTVGDPDSGAEFARLSPWTSGRRPTTVSGSRRERSSRRRSRRARGPRRPRRPSR